MNKPGIWKLTLIAGVKTDLTKLMVGVRLIGSGLSGPRCSRLFDARFLVVRRVSWAQLRSYDVSPS